MPAESRKTAGIASDSQHERSLCPYYRAIAPTTQRKMQRSDAVVATHVMLGMSSVPLLAYEATPLSAERGEQ